VETGEPRGNNLQELLSLEVVDEERGHSDNGALGVERNVVDDDDTLRVRETPAIVEVLVEDVGCVPPVDVDEVVGVLLALEGGNGLSGIAPHDAQATRKTLVQVIVTKVRVLVLTEVKTLNLRSGVRKEEDQGAVPRVESNFEDVLCSLAVMQEI